MDNTNRPFYMSGGATEESLTSPSIDVEESNNRPFYMSDGSSTSTDDTTTTITQPNIDKPSNTELAQYGASLETYLLGDMIRIGQAAFSSKTSEQIEKERMEAIYEKFPWAKSGEYDNDA